MDKITKRFLLCMGLILPAACTFAPSAIGPSTPTPTAIPAAGGHKARSILTAEALLNGFEAASPLDESALARPADAAPAGHVFEGRLELLGEKDGGQMQVLRGELEPEYAYLPEFDFEFVQSDGTLIPVRRGLIVADHPQWNLILEPGAVWQEAGDGGYSRASLPFALTVKGGNTSFNGTMTFLFDDQHVSKVWYQITQETSTSVQADFWGLLDAAYHPGAVAGAAQIKADWDRELAGRLPTRPIEQLAEDYPGLDVSAFGRGVTPEHMTWYGVVANGVNYLGGCRTRFGVYPYCESMRAASFSTAKSAFVSVALMRLAQKYGPEAAGLLIKDYVPEYAASPGDWERVTFNHTIDMSAGNYGSAGYMTDEDGAKMDEFFGAQPYAARIAAAFDWPHAAEPGTHWVYHTGDTFILTRALHNYLQTQEGPQADIFQFVVDEVYRPLGLGPGAYTTMRTADDDWQGQAEGGYGLWWIPDDVAKIATLLNNEDGIIGGEQVLHPGLLAAALQRDPDDRGVKIDSQRMYNNAFWANRYTPADGFDCEFWVPQMLGVSGNVVALLPNGVTYYYFSDNQEFTWDAALREADKISPLCRSGRLTPVPATDSPSSPTGTPIPPASINTQGPLPPLQPVTLANAGNVVLLRTLQIPGLSKSTLSQCSVAFSPDGRLLSGVCRQNTLPIWDAQSGQLLSSLEPSPIHHVAVAFSPDGKRLAAGGVSKSIGLWDVTTDELIRTIGTLSSPVWDLTFSPQGDKLASANFSPDLKLPSLQLWDVSTGEVLWSHGGEGKAGPLILSVDYDPTGKTIACGTFDSVIILDAQTGEPIRTLPIPNHVGDLAFSPDGRLLAAGSDDRKIRLWQTADYELLATWEGHTHYVNGVAFSPDGSFLVSGSHDKTVGIWDVQNGQLLNLLQGHEAAVLRVAVNVSGTLIASISWDGTVRLWGAIETPSPTKTALPPTLTSTPTQVPPTSTPVPTKTPIPDYAALVQLFSYDKERPLDFVVESQEQQGNALVQTVAFTGAEGQAVSAYLVLPAGIGPFPAVIYMHRGNSNKNQFLGEALQLAEMDVASLLLDWPFALKAGYPISEREGYVQTVTDIRRAVDLLETIPTVDSARIGYVGHSFGATWGGVVAGVEPRIKAYVLMAGYAQVSKHDTPEVPDLDAVRYVGHAESPILFQFAEQDEYINAREAKQYYEAASEPKEILWYKASHRTLPKAGWEDRLKWLGEHLGFVE